MAMLGYGTVMGANLFAYCNNNPVMMTDSTGEGWWSDFWNSAAGKITLALTMDVLLCALSLLTANPILFEMALGAIGGGISACIGGIVKDQNLNEIADNFLKNTFIGAIGGINPLAAVGISVVDYMLSTPSDKWTPIGMFMAVGRGVVAGAMPSTFRGIILGSAFDLLDDWLQDMLGNYGVLKFIYV